MSGRKKVSSKLTAKRLRQLLHYNPDTRIWRWHHCSGYNKSFRDGIIAGSIRAPKGRVSWYVIQIDGKAYNASRLAWLYITGKWPKAFIDHIDCDPLNNKWDNLREATSQQNNANRRSLRKHNNHLPKGVYEVTNRKLKKRFGAQIKVNRRSLYLGMYETAEEAHSAYQLAAKIHFGQFARFE